MSEETMFLDYRGGAILLGDVVRVPITINQELHGEWAYYRVRKAPGGYVFSYLRSEKGQILPEGYTAGYMHDQLTGSDEHDMKTLVFTLRPVRVSSWVIMTGAIKDAVLPTPSPQESDNAV